VRIASLLVAGCGDTRSKGDNHEIEGARCLLACCCRRWRCGSHRAELVL